MKHQINFRFLRSDIHKIYRWTLKIVLILLIPALLSCQESVTNTKTTSGDWLIPESEVYDGGPGKDGIPAISQPDLVGNNSINFMDDSNLIIGIKINNQVKGYPHPILDWHEIINDKIDDNYFSITYCPLTGSSIGINRKINGNITTFGVSGLLYNSNLIPYDRATNTNWSQMKLQAVNGELKGLEFNRVNIFETNWKTWKKMFPNSLVVSSNTGYSRNYSRYPYGDYKNNSTLIFPVSRNDNTLPQKERVHGIIENSKTYIFRFNLFNDGIQLYKKQIGGKNYLIVGSKEENFIVSFYNTTQDGTILDFKLVENNLPIILTDDEGNKWDVFGNAVEGKRKGESLTPTKSFIAYWFAWVAFYPQISIIN